MKTRKITTLCVLLLIAVSLLAAPKGAPTEIKIQSGEKWWGLVVNPSLVSLPFEGAFTIDGGTLSPVNYTANMMLSNRGRYVWSANPLMVSFDGKKILVSPSDPNGEAVKVEKSGRSLREAYLMCCHKHFPPQEVGVESVLFESPIYEFGGEDALLYTSEDVVAFAEMLSGRGAPKGTILLPQGWNSPSGAIAFDQEAYPNAKEMIDTLHSRGMKVMLTVTPYIMAAGRGFQQMRKEGRLIADREGKPLVFESRMGYTACRTLSREGVESLNAALRNLQKEYGVDGFYFDCLDAMTLLGNNPTRLVEFLASWHTASEGIDVAIYSSPMGQQLGAIASSLSTTRNYTWEALEESLERAIDASVLGFTRTSLAADLNYHKNDPTLILRTASLAALLPVAIIPYAVWNLPDTKAFCELLGWRAEQGDYYLSLAEQGVASAEPIIRHFEYQFPRTGFTNARDEFMIGSKWLVAPVVSDASVRMVRLPKGKWKEVGTDRTIKGPRVIDVDVSDGKTPIYEKRD
ncbi:MAG: hypothetical protein J6U53_04040 [Tidjanibacter sp.]|nr:hypothetical protein [Tidjanibacter sp.]